jgi:hypothetical protein
VPGPLCAQPQADAKSFVEILAIAEIDDGGDCVRPFYAPLENLRLKPETELYLGSCMPRTAGKERARRIETAK